MVGYYCCPSNNQSNQLDLMVYLHVSNGHPDEIEKKSKIEAEYWKALDKAKQVSILLTCLFNVTS
uniref:Uncharacterized protein n=1 Tax=Tetranychus urticae TaxID=32264 RepID=T1L1X4_TETUR